MNTKTIQFALAFGRYSHMGFLLGVLAVGGFFLGRWIDAKLWGYPILAVLLFLTGFSLGFYRFILMLQEDARRKKKSPPAQAPKK